MKNIIESITGSNRANYESAKLDEFFQLYEKLFNSIQLPKTKNIPASKDLFGNPLKQGDYVLIPDKENPYLKLGIVWPLRPSKPILVVKTLHSDKAKRFAQGYNSMDEIKKCLEDDDRDGYELRQYDFANQWVFGLNSQVDPSNCIKIEKDQLVNLKK